MTFNGHTHKVKNVKILNNTQIFSSAEDDTIKIWDISTGECVNTIKCGDACDIEKLSNFTVASGPMGEFIQIWDTKSGKCLNQLEGHSCWAFFIKNLSNDQFISGSGDKTIKLWNTKNGKCVKTFIGHKKEVNCLDVLSNDRIVSSSGDKTIKVWNLKNGECLQTLIGHSDDVECICVLSEDKIISGSSKGKLKVWCLIKNICVNTIDAHSDRVNDIQLISKDKVVSNSWDEIVKIWDLISNECIKTFDTSVVIDEELILLPNLNGEISECKIDVKTELKNLNKLAYELKSQINTGQYLIEEHCNEIKQQVQLAKKETIFKLKKESEKNIKLEFEIKEKFLKIEERADKMLNEIDAFKQSSIKGYLKIDEKTKEETVQRVDDLIEQQKASLTQSQSEEKTLNDFKGKLEQEREAIKATIFSNQFINFEAKNILEENELIGHFKYERIVYDVIIKN